MKFKMSTETNNKLNEIVMPILTENVDFQELDYIHMKDNPTELQSVILHEAINKEKFGIFELVFKSCFLTITLQTNTSVINDDMFMLVLDYRYELINGGSNGTTVYCTIKNGKIIR